MVVDDDDEAKRVESPNPPPTLNHPQQGPSSHHPSLSAQKRPSSQTSGRPLPPLPTPRQPVVRLPLCTHSVVERRPCNDPHERCDSCGRIPFLGWFFVCVEDTSGFSDPLDPIRGPFLSPWILKAMETGQYTVEERELLIRQKLRVLQMADLERVPSSPSLSMLEAEYGAGECPMQQTGQPSGPQPSLPPLPCTLRACRHCERRFANLEERSWSSINEICNDATIGPPGAFELAGRPISRADIVQTLGWRSVAHPRPDSETSDDGTEGSGQKAFADAFDSPIGLSGDPLSGLVHSVLNIADPCDLKQAQSVSSDSDESGLSVLIGLEVDAESVAGDGADRDTSCGGGVSLRRSGRS